MHIWLVFDAVEHGFLAAFDNRQAAEAYVAWCGFKCRIFGCDVHSKWPYD